MYKKILTYFTLTLCIVFSYSQNKENNFTKIRYNKFQSGNKELKSEDIITYSNSDFTFISSEKFEQNTIQVFPKEVNLYNKSNSHYSQVALFKNNTKISTIDSTSILKQKFDITNEVKKIFNFNCKKATTLINSNTIEIWFTNELPISSPIILGQKLGAVLEIYRNGQPMYIAEKVEKINSKKVFPFENYFKETKKYDNLTFRDIVWKNKFTTVTIFKDELLNFNKNNISNDTILKFNDGCTSFKKIKLPKISPDESIFIQVIEQSNGDAYDRTGSVFLVQDDLINKKTDLLNSIKNTPFEGLILNNKFIPTIELFRFITPFGVKKYNHIQLKDKIWHDAVTYRQDITELCSLLSEKEVWIGMNIGNYDQGGHKLQVEITIHKDSKNPLYFEYALPLFNTINALSLTNNPSSYNSNLFSDKEGLYVEFNLDTPLKNAYLRYITTGHGGWENGDEFIPKPNEIYLNEQKVFSFIPWRQDCGTYRLYNPASGNFNNGLSSSDYSRSNWCPGMPINPNYIYLGDLPAGKHKIQVKIPLGKPENGNSSSWTVSGILLGNK